MHKGIGIYLQCFIIIFNENLLPHGVPPSKYIEYFACKASSRAEQDRKMPKRSQPSAAKDDRVIQSVTAQPSITWFMIAVMAPLDLLNRNGMTMHD